MEILLFLFNLPYVKEILLAIVALGGFGWMSKRNQKNKTAAKNYKKAYEDEKDRKDLDKNVSNMSDSRIDKLLKAWRRD